VQEMGRWVYQRVKEAWRQCGDALPRQRRRRVILLSQIFFVDVRYTSFKSILFNPR
jgi:hypothetical protein